jgi:hypothetical protein
MAAWIGLQRGNHRRLLRLESTAVVPLPKRCRARSRTGGIVEDRAVRIAAGLTGRMSAGSGLREWIYKPAPIKSTWLPPVL